MHENDPIIVSKTLNLVAYLRMYLVMYFTTYDWLERKEPGAALQERGEKQRVC
jgi:hypothetical protein